MGKYRVQYLTVASAVVDVEASSADEARDLADAEFDENGPSLCAHCAGWGQHIGIDLGEWQQDDSAEGVWTNDEAAS